MRLFSVAWCVFVCVYASEGFDFDENKVTSDEDVQFTSSSDYTKDYFTTYPDEDVKQQSTIYTEWSTETTNKPITSTALKEEEEEEENTITSTQSTTTATQSTTTVTQTTSIPSTTVFESNENEINSNENNSGEIQNVCSLCKNVDPEIRNFQMERVNATSVFLTWDPIEEEISDCIYKYTINSTSPRTLVPYFRTEDENRHLLAHLKVCEKYDIVIQANNLCDLKAEFPATFYTDPEEVDSVSIHIYKTHSSVIWPGAISPLCSTFLVTVNEETYKTEDNSFTTNRTLYCSEVQVQTIRADGKLGKGKVGCGKPGQVRNFQINNTMSGSLVLEWDPPENDDCVLHYKLVVLEPNENKEPITEKVKSPYVLEHLNACSTYVITLIAVSKSIEGEESDPYEKSATVREPESLNSLVFNTPIYDNGRVFLRWQPPSNQEKCVKKYLLTIDGEEQEFNSTTYMQDNVIGCREYQYSIQAIAHSGNVSALLPMSYQIPGILMEPPELEVQTESAKTSVEILVNFQTREKNECQATSIKITCLSIDEEKPWREKYVEVDAEIQEGDSATVLVEGLSEYTRYLCTGKVENKAGWSSSSKPVEVVTAEGVPSAPQNFIETFNYSSNTVEFKWDVPFKLPGKLSGYRLVIEAVKSLHYEMKNCTEKVKPIEEELTAEQRTFSYEALPSYRYMSRITAKTYDYGESEEKTFDTPEGVPERPKVQKSWTDVGYLPTYNSSYTVEWNHPCKTRGQVKYFELTLTGSEKYEEEQTSEAPSTSERPETTNDDTETTNDDTETTNDDIETTTTENTETTESAEETERPEESEVNYDRGERVKSTFTAYVPPQENGGYTYTFNNLAPMYAYELSLKTVLLSGNESDKELVYFDSHDGYPSPPTSITIENSELNQLMISWKPPVYSNGILNSYTLRIETIGPIHTVPDGCSSQPKIDRYNVTADKTDSLFNETLPNYKYAVAIAANTKSTEGFASTVLHATKRDKSETVRELKSVIALEETEEYNAKAAVTFKEPCNMNGPLIYYEVVCIGRSTQNEETKDEFRATHLEYDLQLRPSFIYNISVVVVTPGSPHWVSDKAYYGFQAPSGVPPIVTNSPKPVFSDLDSASIKVQLNKNMFSSEAGEVEYYAILLTSGDVYKNGSGFGFYDYKWPQFGYWTNETDYVETYQATPTFWNPFKQRSDDDVAEFVLGTEDCTDLKDYCNGPLRPNTDYYMEIVGITANAFRKYEPSVFKTLELEDLDKASNVVKIIGIVMGVLAFVIIVCGTAFFVYRRRVKRADDEEDGDFDDKPIPTSEFTRQCNDIDKEYADLQAEMENIPYTTEEALIPKNRKKNRYINILPYDNNRVKLNDGEVDYINASYIKGYSKGIEYIATQGPLKSTNVDFWRMILQEKVSLIVMVTQFVENQKEKCYNYIPDLLSEESIGDDITIKCVSELNSKIYCKRKILIKNSTSTWREVIHLQFLNWPDFGCPKETRPMIQLCNTMRETHNSGPIVVHCSAGVGRTGTLIAVDILLQCNRSGRSYNVYETVDDLRHQRKHMVQTQKQYEFIFKCLENNNNCDEKLPEICDPIYVNINGEDMEKYYPCNDKNEIETNL